MTRVLLVVGTVAGGAGQHVSDLAHGLVRRGHHVTVACPTGVDERYGFASSGARVEHIEIAERPSPGRDARSMRVLRRLTKLADVVHAHGVRAGALACLATKNTPVVVTLHNTRPAGSSGLSGVAFDTLERVVAKQADVVLGVSDDLVQRSNEHGARDARIAVVPARRGEGAVRESASVRGELGAPREMLLVVGRLAEQKRIDKVVEIARLVARERPEARWFVAGEGPLREQIQAEIDRVAAPVTLLGHRLDVPDLLAAADLVVSTAQWEGQPVWLQEALAAGRAIVATDVGGTGAVVGDAAVLVSGEEPNEMAAHVMRLLSDPGARAELETAAKRRAAALPTEDDALDHVESVYLDAGAGSIA